MTKVSAVVLGGSGNVGKRLVMSLCADTSRYELITLISRRSLPEFNDDINRGKIQVKIVSDLEKMNQHPMEKHDVAFMLLGAGKPSMMSKDDLFRVDCSIAVAFANLCEKSGVTHFSALSALGANIDEKYGWLTKTNAGG